MSASKKNKARDQFKFVNYTGPHDARKTNNRIRVRSHVTRWQHKHSRVFPEQPKAVDKDRDVGTGTDGTKELVSDKSNLDKPVNVADPSKRPGHGDASSTKVDCSRQGNDEVDTKTILLTPEACRLAGGGALESFSRGAMSFRAIALQDSQNIIGVGLKGMQLELSSVMGLYKNICETQAIDFARQYNVGGDRASWGRFYAFVYTDPILLSTAVLLGVRNQLDVLGKCIDGQTFASVLQIERFLMRSIQDALSDPIRGISDQMLIAVALCAAYEIKHGTGACYHIHMRGLVQMIHLRGGLPAIGSPDPYIVRLLTWIDTNTSKIAGCKPYLQGMSNGLASHPNANTAVFRARGEVVS